LIKALSPEDKAKLKTQGRAYGQWIRAHVRTNDELKAFLERNGYFDDPITGALWKCLFSAYEQCKGTGAKLHF